jgi:hypothetical protein
LFFVSTLDQAECFQVLPLEKLVSKAQAVSLPQKTGVLCETIIVELSDERFHFVVAEVQWKYLALQSLLIPYYDCCAVLSPGD